MTRRPRRRSWALTVLYCTLPRSDRIFGWMLPNCHPIARCLLHQEFGKPDRLALSDTQAYLAPRSFKNFGTPLLYPAAAPRRYTITIFEAWWRGAMVLP